MAVDYRLDALVAATNDIVRLPPPPTAADLRRVCTTACHELGILAGSEWLFAAAQRPGASAAAQELDGVFADLDRFDAFLRMELHLLQKQGLDASATAVLLEHARMLRSSLQRRSSLPLRAGIEDLRDEACEMADRLKPLADVEGRRQSARAVLERAAFVLGGAAVVGINATATSLGQVYAEASKAVGIALINNGVRKG